ncbi:hypothetical protein JCM9140_1159 [Halalkalibacter wakoensis JCM 9140]|uniref:Uncharacterized protein n=1 Tax=Halalkalibacter wakoensis JCM 9140 TaxID=1236970 RepID=W4PZQ4_9BACI|nr:hypothetical protein [Halalkalibacter wakoensis]GAE25180.1 hypothetical protein JCM9140_1159 [Halalkalibacter wakoensis JCM 9140]
MTSAIWLFVLATVIAVIGIVIQFKKLMVQIQTKIDQNENVTTESLQKENSRFFVRVVMVEVIPIVLVILGFILMESMEGAMSLSQVLPALLIVIISLLFGVINVFLAKNQAISNQDVSIQTKATLTTMTFTGMSLVAAFPIISIVAMVMALSI